MYLKKLSVQGFKSFPNRTRFEFGPGVTAIVGPNGSGKSNVTDAIRWVLGEQSVKLLRAKRADDVIFSGGRDRAAVGMAEVILTLDNENKWLPVDFAEVELGRRVYRSGESEYLLNGSRVRLKDLLDLMAKGEVGQNSYSIMGQGLVDRVLSMSSQERRAFLDEAADVKRFRAKIEDAYNRLASTRENIGRVELIISEIEPRLNQLRRQAERAGEHVQLARRLAELLREYYSYMWNDAQNAVVRARATLDQQNAEDNAAEAKVAQFNEQLRALGDNIRKRREAIGKRDETQAAVEARVAELEREITLDRERHAMVVARREEVSGEIQALEAERLALSTTDLDEGRRGVEIAEETETARALVAQAKDALSMAEREYGGLRVRAQELRSAAEGQEARRKEFTSAKDKAEARLGELERSAEQLEARRKHLLVELIGYARRFAELRERSLGADTRLEDSRQASVEARERLQRVQAELREYEAASNENLRKQDHLEGRLDALRRVQAEHEGVAVGTRNALIMGQALIEDVEPGSLGEPPEIPGVMGLLARQIRVPAGLETAVNAALEQRLHAIVIEKSTDALKAIDALRNRREGRAQFLPLDTLSHVYPLNLQKESGVVGVAAKLVKCDNAFRNVVDTLLGRVIIVEDADAARRMISRGLGSVVTLDGTFVEPTGVISGGSSGVEEGAFRRQHELDELPKQIEELREHTKVTTAQIEKARAAHEQLSRLAGESEGAYEALRRELEVARNDLDRERDRLHRLRRDMDAVLGEQAANRTERENCLRTAAEASAELRTIDEGQNTGVAELARIEQELEESSKRRDAALEAVAETSGRLAAVDGERKSLEFMRAQHEKSIERLASQLSERSLRARNLELEAGVINERIAKLTASLTAARAEQERASGDMAPDRDELHRLESHERAIQEEYREAQASMLRVQRHRLALEADLSRATETLQGLKIEMERDGLTPNQDGEIVPIESGGDDEDRVRIGDRGRAGQVAARSSMSMRRARRSSLSGAGFVASDLSMRKRQRISTRSRSATTS